MRMILLAVVALAVGGGILYVLMTQQQHAVTNVQSAQGEMQKKADAYKKSQEDMMKQLQQ